MGKQIDSEIEKEKLRFEEFVRNDARASGMRLSVSDKPEWSDPNTFYIRKNLKGKLEVIYYNYEGSEQRVPLNFMTRKASFEWFVQDRQYCAFKNKLQEKEVKIADKMLPYTVYSIKSKFSEAHPLLIESTQDNNIFRIHYRDERGCEQVYECNISQDESLKELSTIANNVDAVEAILSKRNIIQKARDFIRDGSNKAKINAGLIKDSVVKTWKSGPKGKAKVIIIVAIVVVVLAAMITAIVLSAGGATPAAVASTQAGLTVGAAAVKSAAEVAAIGAALTRVGIIIGGLFGGALALTGLSFGIMGIGMLIKKGITRVKNNYIAKQFKKSGDDEQMSHIRKMTSASILGELSRKGQKEFDCGVTANINRNYIALHRDIDAYFENYLNDVDNDSLARFKEIKTVVDLDMSFFKDQIKAVNDYVNNTTGVAQLRTVQANLKESISKLKASAETTEVQIPEQLLKDTQFNQEEYIQYFQTLHQEKQKMKLMIDYAILNNLESAMKRLEATFHVDSSTKVQDHNQGGSVDDFSQSTSESDDEANQRASDSLKK